MSKGLLFGLAGIAFITSVALFVYWFWLGILGRGDSISYRHGAGWMLFAAVVCVIAGVFRRS